MRHLDIIFNVMLSLEEKQQRMDERLELNALITLF